MEYQYVSFDDLVNDNNLPFTRGMLRKLFMDRNKNGLDSAVRKIGKRLYVRKDLFIAWIEKHPDRTD